MALNERQDGILGILKEQKRATVEELAGIFFVSEATIRRDLKEMKTMGLIERSHSGTFLPENSEEISLFYRMERNARVRFTWRIVVRCVLWESHAY